MFMKTVLADGQAEQQVIREMKARAAGARGDIEQIVRGVMADVQQRGWDAVVEYAERFDGKAPYIVEPKVLDDAYNACDPKLIAALEKAATNIRDENFLHSFSFSPLQCFKHKKRRVPNAFFCMKIYFHYCNISLLRNWSFPHEYFNMYFFEFLLWYCYDIAMTEICP